VSVRRDLRLVYAAYGLFASTRISLLAAGGGAQLATRPVISSEPREGRQASCHFSSRHALPAPCLAALSCSHSNCTPSCNTEANAPRAALVPWLVKGLAFSSMRNMRGVALATVHRLLLHRSLGRHPCPNQHVIRGRSTSTTRATCVPQATDRGGAPPSLMALIQALLVWRRHAVLIKCSTWTSTKRSTRHAQGALMRRS